MIFASYRLICSNSLHLAGSGILGLRVLDKSKFDRFMPSSMSMSPTQTVRLCPVLSSADSKAFLAVRKGVADLYPVPDSPEGFLGLGLGNYNAFLVFSGNETLLGTANLPTD